MACWRGVQKAFASCCSSDRSRTVVLEQFGGGDAFSPCDSRDSLPAKPLCELSPKQQPCPSDSEGQELEAEGDQTVSTADQSSPRGLGLSGAPKAEGGPGQRKTWEVNNLVFSSDFDSGNCGGVREVEGEPGASPENTDASPKLPKKSSSTASGGSTKSPRRFSNHRLFRVHCRSDCEGTSFETAECAWFHFSVAGTGVKEGQKLEFQVGNPKHKLKLRRLLYDGMRPVVRSVPSMTEWRFVSGECKLKVLKDRTLVLTFSHTISRVSKGEVLYFATCFPYPLEQVSKLTATFEQKMRSSGVYFHREKLCESLEGHPVELLTVSALDGKCDVVRQPPIPGFTPSGTRPHVFPDRQAIFISARVHPGETPASYVLEGILRGLAGSRRGLDAAKLLRRYVFFIVPVLNPDGVAMGHHRTDARGVNLNRMYGQADREKHAPILAAEGACRIINKWQGGIRLYLDLHAHGSRRGCFTFGDDGEEGLTARSRLYCYALARRCPIFEYPQCVFTHNSEGTGKSVMSQCMDKALCFTLETNYCRGHYSTEPFTPAAWIGLGASCLEALLDIDVLEGYTGPEAPLASPRPPADPAGPRSGGAAAQAPSPRSGGAAAQAPNEPPDPDMVRAAAWFANACKAWASSGSEPAGLDVEPPCRTRPGFAMIRSPCQNYNPSPELWPHVECFGEPVELLEAGKGWYKVALPTGGTLWLPERDLVLQDSLIGRFFYRVILDADITDGPEPSSSVVHTLRSGTLLEASERRVVNGHLRVLVAGNDGGFKASGWISEYRSLAFDPRLGGELQLMRLRVLPGSRQDR